MQTQSSTRRIPRKWKWQQWSTWRCKSSGCLRPWGSSNLTIAWAPTDEDYFLNRPRRRGLEASGALFRGTETASVPWIKTKSRRSPYSSPSNRKPDSLTLTSGQGSNRWFPSDDSQRKDQTALVLTKASRPCLGLVANVAVLERREPCRNKATILLEERIDERDDAFKRRNKLVEGLESRISNQRAAAWEGAETYPVASWETRRWLGVTFA